MGETSEGVDGYTEERFRREVESYIQLVNGSRNNTTQMIEYRRKVYQLLRLYGQTFPEAHEFYRRTVVDGWL